MYKRFLCQVPVYKRKDDTGEILKPELQKVIIKNDDVYRVEKALLKRKRRADLVDFDGKDVMLK